MEQPGKNYVILDTDVKMQPDSDNAKDKDKNRELTRALCNHALPDLCSEVLSGDDCQRQHQRRPTHFVALRLLSLPLQDTVKELQHEFCYNAQVLTGHSQSMFHRFCYPPQKLHISLAVLALSPHAVPQMCRFLDEWYTHIGASQMPYSRSEWSVQFPSINSFNGDVIYLEPDAASRHLLIEPLAAGLSHVMLQKQQLFGAGAVIRCCSIPHATILKIPPVCSRQQQEGCIRQIPRAAWESLRMPDIGKVPLQSVQLLDMRQQSANEPGYFKVDWQGTLPLPSKQPSSVCRA